jgi:hypothetical protein
LAFFLLESVAHSLDKPSIEDLEEELIELELLEYCKPFLEEYRKKSSEANPEADSK